MPGSLTTPGRPGARYDAPGCIAFRYLHGVGTQKRTLLYRAARKHLGTVDERRLRPCRPQTPWYGGWMRDAFAPIVRARPGPTFGRPVRHGVAPIDYGPVLLLMPFGSRLTADTLPSGL